MWSINSRSNCLKNCMRCRTRNSGSLEIGEAVVERTPLELFEDFYEQQNHKPMSEEQKQFICGLIESIWE